LILGVASHPSNVVDLAGDYESHKSVAPGLGRRWVRACYRSVKPPMPTRPSKPPYDAESGLRHQLTAGQMAMVAVGGSIGTGLLLGTAAAIELAGPAVIISFIIAAFISWTV